MRILPMFVALTVVFPVMATRAVSADALPPAANAFSLNLPGDGDRARDRQGVPVAVALAWLTANAPECPPAVAPEVAAKFVEQLRQRLPADVDRLGDQDFPVARFESLLWQTAAARLTGPAYATQREAIALRRLRSVSGAMAARDAEAALTRIKTASTAAHRRLLEGRMDDDELLRLLEADRRPDPSVATKLAPAVPKVLSASELISEFARRNQVGAAAARLRGYQVEARVRNPDGSTTELRLFKLRPDLFRVHLRPATGDTQVVAFDGMRYWRQAGPRVEVINSGDLGPLRHLAEFLDPLFDPEGCTFERLADVARDGRSCHRIRVRRADGSNYVAILDAENFHQVGRENTDGSSTRYTDFREIAGLTVAHREEVAMPAGGTVTLEIVRFVANPGLITAFFQTPSAQQLDLGPLEQLLVETKKP